MSVFHEIPQDSYLHEGKYFFLIYDKFPVSPGHILIVTKESRLDYLSLTSPEKQELTSMIDEAVKIIELQHKPDGFNIGINNGEVAGQTVFHFHCHVIPRYSGDMEDPSGGIRHAVKGRGYYRGLK